MVLVLGLGLFARPVILHAQSAPDSIVAVTAANQGLSQVAREDLPLTGTFWLITSNGYSLPMPCAPLDQTLPIYAVSDTVFIADGTGGLVALNLHRAGYDTVAGVLAAQANDVVALVNQIATTQMLRPIMRAMGMDTPMDEETSGGSGFNNGLAGYTWDTNQLWLEITNISNDTAFVNLHNATNQVYAIWSTTNLVTPMLTPWQVETELWPGDTNCQPFTLQAFGRQNLFLRAEDWTGIDSDSDGIPDWWAWNYFGVVSVNATNHDAFGNTLLYDYQNSVDPSPIVFSIRPIQYVNTTTPALPLTILGGTPFYMAVLVNDYNTDDAVWVPYNTNLTASLSGGDGNYDVQIGLRSHATDSTPTWRQVSLILDTVAPVLTITNPSSLIVSNTIINLQGFANETLSAVSFDVSNAGGTVTNQAGYLTGSYLDYNVGAYTTNYFTCPNATLAGGSNSITIHAADLAGNTTSLNLALNCVADTSPPTLNVISPVAGQPISGSSFTVQAQVSNPAAKLSATIIDESGNTNTIQGLVENNGLAWVNNLPLGTGNNTVTVTAVFASGVTNTQTFTVIGNDIGLVVDPLTQFNQASVTVTGSVGDPDNDCVFVNGIRANYTDDLGDWEADNVPVSANGTAALKVEVYVGDPVLIGTLTQFVPQPVTVATMSYQVQEHKEYNSVIYWTYENPGNHRITHGSYNDDNLDDTGINWLAGAGGVAQSVGFDDNLPGTYDTQNSFGPNQSDFQAAGWLWENATVDVPAWSDTTADGWPEWGSFQRQAATRVQLVPPGGQANGLTNVYLVRFAAAETDNFPPDWDESLLPLPPETFEIGNQPLVNTGETNMDDSTANGAVWGMTTISALAGQNVEVTPSLITPPQGNWDYYYDIQACQLYPPMVDVNRDGVIDGNDVTSASQPYRFWVNDDHDGYDANGVQDDLDPSTGDDATSNSITCTRDLEDYTRLWLNVQGITNELQNGTFLLALQWEGVTGSPAIRLFPAADTTNGGTGYLTDTNAAQAQITAPFGTNIVDQSGQTVVASSAPFFFTTNFWQNYATNPVTHLLFDGVSAGSGKLVLAIYKNDGVTKLGEGQPLYLDLDEITNMYERWTVGEGNGTTPATNATLLSDFQHTSGSPEANQYILFVHGYNWSPWQKDAYAETSFKRLYWQGYKGRFGSFLWPTAYHDSTLGTVVHYDSSEYIAWQSASGLEGLLNSLHSQYGSSVYILAHSLGNVVVGEALRKAAQDGLGQLVNTYVASQGAVPGNCYDSTLSGSDLLGFAGGTLGPTTANIYNNWMTTNSAAVGTKANFYNVNDYALGKWQLDQETKPDTLFGISPPYGYRGSPSDNPPLQDGFYSTYPAYVGPFQTTLYLGNASSISNRYEISAFAAEPRSLAIGGISSVAGFTPQDLTSLWPPDDSTTDPTKKYSARQWHDAEFFFSNAEQQNYWHTLLNKYQLLSSPANP